MLRPLLPLLAAFPLLAQTPERINPKEWTPASYSHAVAVSGKLLYISGQVSQDAKGQPIHANDFENQVKQAFANLKTVLAAAGLTPSHVVKMNYYVLNLDASRLATIRSVRNGFFDAKNPPASTLVGVAALFQPGYLIEIEAIAQYPESH
jgi:enamine deaminase RidA (YjgF/YER057c/UK114 family)